MPSPPPTRSANALFSQHIRARSWSQSEVAERINAAYEIAEGRAGRYTAESIRRLTCGQVAMPQKPYRRAIEEVFGLTLADLGFEVRRPDRRTGDGEEDEDVRRIDFLRGLAAVGGGALLTGGLSATLEDAIVHTPVPRLIGMDHVTEVAEMAVAVRRADHLGHPFGWEVMAAQVRRAIALLGSATDHTVATSMHAATAALADAVGWAHFDAGLHVPADRFFRIGVHCASEAGSFWLRADILSDMARQAIYLDRPDDALSLLGAAKVREDRISHLRRANLSAVQARAYGALGNVRETLRSVRDADEHFHDAATARDEPDFDNFSAYFDFGQLNGDTAHGLYGIAVHGHAVAETRHRLRIAAEHYGPEWARSRAFCLTLDAALALQAGEVDEGSALGLTALDAAADIGPGSQRLAANVRQIHDIAAGIDAPVLAPLQQRAMKMITM